MNTTQLHREFSVCLLLVTVLLILPAYLHAQSSFTAITEQFDSALNRYTDTIAITHVWKDANGKIDSTHNSIRYYSTQDRQFFWNEYKCYNWVEANLPDGYFHPVPIEFAQYGTRGVTPLRQFTSFLSKPNQSSEQVLTITNGLLRNIKSKHYDGERLEYRRINEFAYSEHEDPVSERNYKVTGVDTMLILRILNERIYDSQGSTLSLRTRSAQYDAALRTSDSQFFEYGEDNRLRSATQWFFQSGDPTRGLKQVFHAWHRYEPMPPFFSNGVYEIAGLDFSSSTTYEIDVSNHTTLKHIEDRVQQFDVDGRKITETAIDLSGKGQTWERDYYFNGDFKELRHRQLPGGDTAYPAISVENEYRSDGAILTSILRRTEPPYGSAELSLRERTRFVYHSSKVQFDPDFKLVDRASLGRHIDLSSIQGLKKVQVITTIGAVAFEAITLETFIDLSNLPSGLYFISIDGGKPRKHLIP